MLQQLTPGYDKAARLKAALQRQKRQDCQSATLQQGLGRVKKPAGCPSFLWASRRLQERTAAIRLGGSDQASKQRSLELC